MDAHKILFLDIDGVLNSTDNSSSRIWDYNQRDKYGCLFDERCVRWLWHIVNETQCKLVISSAWRGSGLSVMQEMWEMRDLPGEVIGCTPISVSEYTINKYACTNNEADRGYEIQQYIDEHEIKTYCIVDDECDMLPHQKFVRTNHVFGIDGKAANDIIVILNSI